MLAELSPRSFADCKLRPVHAFCARFGTLASSVRAGGGRGVQYSWLEPKLKACPTPPHPLLVLCCSSKPPAAYIICQQHQLDTLLLCRVHCHARPQLAIYTDAVVLGCSTSAGLSSRDVCIPSTFLAPVQTHSHQGCLFCPILPCPKYFFISGALMSKR